MFRRSKGSHNRLWLGVTCLVMALAIVALTLPGCAKAPAGAVEPVKVGVCLGLTGINAEACKYMKEGIEFAVDEILAAGGIKSLGGAPIRLIYADTEGDPKVCIAELERLITKEKVSLVLGPYIQTEFNQAAPIADKYHVPLLGIRSTSDIMYFPAPPKYAAALGLSSVKSYGWFWADNLDKLIKEYGLKVNRIALVYEDIKVIHEMMAGTKEGLEKAGLLDKLVLEMAVDPAAPDMAPIAARVKEAKPDAVIGPAVFSVAMNIFRAMDAVKFYPPLQFSSDTAMGSPKAIAALGDELAAKMLFAPGRYFVGYYTAKVDRPYVRAFEAKAAPYLKAKGMPVIEIDFVCGVQSMYCMWEALERAGSRDPEAINKAFRSQSLKPGGPYFIMPSYEPALEWLEVGAPVHHIFLYEFWKDRKVEVAYPKDMRSAEPLLPEALR